MEAVLIKISREGHGRNNFSKRDTNIRPKHDVGTCYLYNRGVGLLNYSNLPKDAEPGSWFDVKVCWENKTSLESSSAIADAEVKSKRSPPLCKIERIVNESGDPFTSFTESGIVLDVAKEYMLIWNDFLGLVTHFNSDVDLDQQYRKLQVVTFKAVAMCESRHCAFYAQSVGPVNSIRFQNLFSASDAEVRSQGQRLFAVCKNGDRVLLLASDKSILEKQTSQENAGIIEGDQIDLTYYKIYTYYGPCYISIFYSKQDDEYFHNGWDQQMESLCETCRAVANDGDNNSKPLKKEISSSDFQAKWNQHFSKFWDPEERGNEWLENFIGISSSSDTDTDTVDRKNETADSGVNSRNESRNEDGSCQQGGNTTKISKKVVESIAGPIPVSASADYVLSTSPESTEASSSRIFLAPADETVDTIEEMATLRKQVEPTVRDFSFNSDKIISPKSACEVKVLKEELVHDILSVKQADVSIDVSEYSSDLNVSFEYDSMGENGTSRNEVVNSDLSEKNFENQTAKTKNAIHTVAPHVEPILSVNTKDEVSTISDAFVEEVFMHDNQPRANTIWADMATEKQIEDIRNKISHRDFINFEKIKENLKNADIINSYQNATSSVDRSNTTDDDTRYTTDHVYVKDLRPIPTREKPLLVTKGVYVPDSSPSRTARSEVSTSSRVLESKSPSLAFPNYLNTPSSSTASVRDLSPGKSNGVKILHEHAKCAVSCRSQSPQESAGVPPNSSTTMVAPVKIHQPSNVRVNTSSKSSAELRPHPKSLKLCARLDDESVHDYFDRVFSGSDSNINRDIRSMITSIMSSPVLLYMEQRCTALYEVLVVMYTYPNYVYIDDLKKLDYKNVKSTGLAQLDRYIMEQYIMKYVLLDEDLWTEVIRCCPDMPDRIGPYVDDLFELG